MAAGLKSAPPTQEWQEIHTKAESVGVYKMFEVARKETDPPNIHAEYCKMIASGTTARDAIAVPGLEKSLETFTYETKVGLYLDCGSQAKYKITVQSSAP